MKLAIFVDQFPARSQTFVTNQVVGLLALGIEVTVVSLSTKTAENEKDLLAIHPKLPLHTVYLLNEHAGTFAGKVITRVMSVIKALFRAEKRKTVIRALSRNYGQHGKSLLLASIASKLEQPLSFDLVLCHFGYNAIVANKLHSLGLLTGKMATIFHGYDISAVSALTKYTNDYQELFAQAQLMLPISQLWKNKLIALGCPAEKIQVHRMGVDLNLFEYDQHSQLNKQKNNLFRLFTVARFSEKKGLEYAIRALALLANDIYFHYYLGGFGELEQELRKLVIELQLEDKITFLGALDQQQVKKHMLAADAFIQPSVTAQNGDMEGVPVAIMEAMAMGIPVLSTFHSGIPELITNNEHGLLAQECDAHGLANNIERLYRDENLVKQLIINARRQIEIMSDVDKLNQQLLVILAAELSK